MQSRSRCSYYSLRQATELGYDEIPIESTVLCLESAGLSSESWTEGIQTVSNLKGEAKRVCLAAKGLSR
jgi:hypothetical protein